MLANYLEVNVEDIIDMFGGIDNFLDTLSVVSESLNVDYIVSKAIEKYGVEYFLSIDRKEMLLEERYYIYQIF